MLKSFELEHNVSGKLTDFNVASDVHEDVVALDIAVDDSLTVKVLQSSASLLKLASLYLVVILFNVPLCRLWQSACR